MASIIYTISTTKEYSPSETLNFDPTSEEAVIHNNILSDILNMPKTMKQLGFVQFFSWFGLFSMWVYTSSAISQHIFGLPSSDKSSEAFNDAGNWTGIIFGIYNGVSAIYAFLIPKIAEKIGRKKNHAASLLFGALGLISIYFAPNKEFLIFSMIGIGMAWGSILAMPYAILRGAVPMKKMGVYMGIFNLFITIPQIFNAIIGGLILKYFFNGHAIYSLL